MTTATRSKMDYLDVKNLAQTGEGMFLEFKRTVPDARKIAREIAAFANSHGGTLLVGVDDDGSLIGVDGYQEEKFLLDKASDTICDPPVNITVELVQFGMRDLLVIGIPEVEDKPVYLNHNDEAAAFMRKGDSCKRISYEQIKILEHENSGKPVTFQYGPAEQKLFRYLNEYREINVIKFAHLIGENHKKAADILINLVNAKILRLFTKDKIDYFTFSKHFESK